MRSDPDLRNEGTRASGPERVEVVVALAAVALGLFVLAGSFSIDLGSGYDRIGPRLFPYVVAAGMLLSGSFLARGAFLHERYSGEALRSRTSWSAIITLSVALGSSVFLLERAGFILTSTLLFWLVARAFASERPWRDAAVGLVLSLAVYFAFTRGLGLVLPRGILDGLL